MSDSPFGPVQSGLVGNRAHDDRRVIKFPSARERQVRQDLRHSSDPIDVATHFDTKSRKQEIARRLKEPQIKEPLSEKMYRFLGLDTE